MPQRRYYRQKVKIQMKPIPSTYTQIKSRFKTEWINNLNLRTHYDQMDAISAAIESLTGNRTKLADAGTLSPKGMTDQVRQIAAKSAVPALKRAAEHVDRVNARLDERRRNLVTPKIDRKDVVAEMRNQEYRAHLKTLNIADKIAAVTSDPAIAAAFLDGHPALSGASNEQRAQIEEIVARTSQPEALQEIDTERDALAVLGAVIDIGLSDLKKQTGFENSQRDFDQWMATVSAPAPVSKSGDPGHIEWPTFSTPMKSI